MSDSVTDEYEGLEIGDLVEYEGKEIVFRGPLISGTPATPGLWIDPESHEFIVVDRRSDDSVKNMMDSVAGDPRSRMASAVIDDSPPTGPPERLSSDEILRFEHHADDDDMVRTLKEAVNASGITVRNVSEGIQGGYNLVYGLRKRHSIKYESVLKWCEILRLRSNFSLDSIDRV